MRKPFVLLAGLALLASSFAASADEPCRYSEPRNAEIDAAGLKLLSVQIGADNLFIHGQPGLTRVVVQGTACASDQEWLKDVKVETARQGDTATLVANDGDHGVVISLFHNYYAYLKLDVRVPLSLAVKLAEGSGDASASDLAALDATLGSGDLKVKSIAGEFGLAVGSGDADASDVGSLNLASVGSGDASVDGVHGDAHVGDVGSGDLGLRNVKGGVTMGALSSGSVKLMDVGGSVKVQSVGSGELVVQDVTGDVAVGSVSSGDVSIERAGGNVSADSVGSGGFDADGVGGNFSVGTVGSGDVRPRNVKGKVSVPQED